MTDAKVVVPTARRLLICISIFGNLLIAATWRLWIPPLDATWTDQACSFPRVPLFAGLRQLSPAWDYGFVGLCLAASWGLLFAREDRKQRVASWLFVAGAAGLMVTNQHRIQPWIYQMGILLLMRILLAPTAWLRFTRWQLISIYLFSAWSKLDATFVQSLGQQFLDVALGPWGLAPEDATWRTYLAFAFPCGELLIGLGLMLAPTRRSAAALGIGLHLALIGILGPWGLNHQLGVLLWNFQFIVMLCILFLLPQPSEPTGEGVARWKRGLVWAVLLLPLLETVGLWDHWPAWQLYAPRNSRVTLQLLATEDHLAQVPGPLRGYLRSDENALYQRVDLDSWSLESLRAPIYPQARFQVGVALDFLQRSDLTDAGKLTVEGPADRWTGKRQQTVHRGAEIRQAARAFRLNAMP